MSCSRAAVLTPLNLVFRHPDRLREPRREHLHAADVRLARAILGVDRERQRLDRGEVQVGYFLHVALLVFDAAQIDLVAAIGQVQRRRREQRDPVVGRAADDNRDACGRHCAHEVARGAPEKVFVPDLEQVLVRGEGDRSGNEHRVAQEVRTGRAEQRFRHRGKRHRRETGNAAQGIETPHRPPAR